MAGKRFSHLEPTLHFFIRAIVLEQEIEREYFHVRARELVPDRFEAVERRGEPPFAQCLASRDFLGV